MAALLLALVLSARADVPRVSPDGTILYVVSHTTDTRSEPSPNGRILSRLKTFDIVTGREVLPGWLEIELSTAAGDLHGHWIPIERDNVVDGSLEAIKYRVSKAEQARWPERVRLDIARGRIRRGFTAEQVRLTLGDPLGKTLRHDIRGAAEEWIYADMRVVVSLKGVVEILPGPAR